MFNIIKKLLKNKLIKKDIIINNEKNILTHLNNNDTSIYVTYKRRLIPFIYSTLMLNSKCSCTIFIKHFDNIMISEQEFKKILSIMQKNNIFIEIIILEQNESFTRIISDLNFQSSTKIQLYIGEFNGIGKFQNFIISDGIRYMLEKAYYIDYDYSDNTIEANYSMNNPLSCKWLIHLFQQYKNQILGTLNK